MTLRLRKAKGSRPEPPGWAEDDYDVISGGAVVGRIYKRTGASDDGLPWTWSLLVVAPGMTTIGLARDLEQAKAAFTKHWRALELAGKA